MNSSPQYARMELHRCWTVEHVEFSMEELRRQSNLRSSEGSLPSIRSDNGGFREHHSGFREHHADNRRASSAENLGSMFKSHYHGSSLSASLEEDVEHRWLSEAVESSKAVPSSVAEQSMEWMRKTGSFCALGSARGGTEHISTQRVAKGSEACLASRDAEKLQGSTGFLTKSVSSILAQEELSEAGIPKLAQIRTGGSGGTGSGSNGSDNSWDSSTTPTVDPGSRSGGAGAWGGSSSEDGESRGWSQDTVGPLGRGRPSRSANADVRRASNGLLDLERRKALAVGAIAVKPGGRVRRDVVVWPVEGSSPQLDGVTGDGLTGENARDVSRGRPGTSTGKQALGVVVETGLAREEVESRGDGAAKVVPWGRREREGGSSSSSGARERDGATEAAEGSGKVEGRERDAAEVDMMMEKFAKLLLGEDMSGMGKGVCSALAISNAIVNLSVAVFGQLWRLEPLAKERKEKWRREMEWMTSVADHIVELVPSTTTTSAGCVTEVMVCRQRKDLLASLPALRKLDNMLLDLLDSFHDTEFWYDDDRSSVPNSSVIDDLGEGPRGNRSSSFNDRPPVLRLPKNGMYPVLPVEHHQRGLDQGVAARPHPQAQQQQRAPAHPPAGESEPSSGPELLSGSGGGSGAFGIGGSSSLRHPDKWWLPDVKVPLGGLSDPARKELQRQRNTAAQILKAAMAINASVLSEMEIPEPYLQNLPKTGKSALGGFLYYYLTSESFECEKLLSYFDLNKEHVVLDAANRLEAATCLWRSKLEHAGSNSSTFFGRFRDSPQRGGFEVGSNSSEKWEKSGQEQKWEMYIERATMVIMMLHQRCPNMRQTALESFKIQFNKDVGHSILESYSRVLESLSSNIVSCSDDVIHADNNARGLSLPGSSHSSFSSSGGSSSISSYQQLYHSHANGRPRRGGAGGSTGTSVLATSAPPGTAAGTGDGYLWGAGAGGSGSSAGAPPSSFLLLGPAGGAWEGAQLGIRTGVGGVTTSSPSPGLSEPESPFDHHHSPMSPLDSRSRSVAVDAVVAQLKEKGVSMSVGEYPAAKKAPRLKGLGKRVSNWFTARPAHEGAEFDTVSHKSAMSHRSAGPRQLGGMDFATAFRSFEAPV